MGRGMGKTAKGPTLGNLLFYAIILGMSLYFVFAAVQGDFGLFKRIQIDAEAGMLSNELDALQTEVAAMTNKTRRLSDDYLDLDLLDEQARDILGVIRPDEVVIN